MRSTPAFWDEHVLGVTGADNSSGSNWGSEGTDFRDSSSTFWNGGKNSSSTTPSVYRVSAYTHFATTDMQGESGYVIDAEQHLNATSFETNDYTDFTGIGGSGEGGTSAACAQVSALAALIYSRALKIGRLDGGTDDVTPEDVIDAIVGNLKDDHLFLSGQSSGNTIPGVIHFRDAKDEF